MMYAMICTHPDISQAVSVFSNYMANLDSDYAGYLDKRRFLTSYVFTLSGCTINRKALHSTVALSTTEAEYMAATKSVKKAIWLKGFVGDLGLQQGDTLVFCDSTVRKCLQFVIALRDFSGGARGVLRTTAATYRGISCTIRNFEPSPPPLQCSDLTVKACPKICQTPKVHGKRSSEASPCADNSSVKKIKSQTREPTRLVHRPDPRPATYSLPKTVTAARPSSSSRNGSKYCKNCHKQGHFLSKCPTIQCRYCHKIGYIVYNCPTKPPKPGQSGILPRPVNHSVASAAEESPSAPSLSSV
uniref:CCHC-type domain-containing protein n=1 Tax=Fagus sylvatica TaxID=28930 RepID=A0A2N9EXI7_FAGSY